MQRAFLTEGGNCGEVQYLERVLGFFKSSKKMVADADCSGVASLRGLDCVYSKLCSFTFYLYVILISKYSKQSREASRSSISF